MMKQNKMQINVVLVLEFKFISNLLKKLNSKHQRQVHIPTIYNIKKYRKIKLGERSIFPR